MGTAACADTGGIDSPDVIGMGSPIGPLAIGPGSGITPGIAPAVGLANSDLLEIRLPPSLCAIVRTVTDPYSAGRTPLAQSTKPW